MKITLHPYQFVFTPSTNTISFSNMGGGFKPERLLAVTNVTTGKLIYAVASQASGYNGSFSTNIYTNDTLTYVSSNVGQSASDIIECLYDSDTDAQLIAGTVTVSPQPLDVSAVPVPVKTQAADGTAILSTVDPITGGDGLNVHLQSSAYGGELGQPLPSSGFGYQSALSMGFLNNGVLVTPKLDPVTNELMVQGTFTAPALQAVDLASVDGAPVALGQTGMAQSIPVTIASDQKSLNVNVTQSVSQDILGVAIGGNRNNQIEISFNSTPGASLITNSFTGSGTVTVSNGHSVYATGATATSSAKAVSVQTTTYRPAHEIYSAFTAAFLNQISTSVQRIGLFDANNGFFIGFVGTTFGVTVRNGAADTFTSQGSFNVDTLLGNITSKFTRNGTPEAVNFGFSNLYRIRFAWLGSANILFEIFSPDGEWVLFHNIRQPNTSYNPSIQSPNLPMNLEVVKSSGANNVSIATACWGAGTTSAYSPISSTLTDNTLAAMTRSVITGVTTGGGGNYVNVKVNPSGALVTENTQSGTASQNIAQYGGVATTLGQKAMTASMPVVLASDQSAVSTNISQYGGTSTTLGQKAMSASMPVTIASDQSSLPTTTNINQYGGAAVSLGQKVMTASMPVVISSDQSNVNTLQPDVYITGAVTNLLNNNLILASAGSSSYDAAGYKSGSIQVVTAATSGNFTFEGSNDNTNFQVIPVFRNDLASPPAILTSITATASQFIYTFPIKFRYLRLRISSALNNNCQAFTKLSQESWSPTIPTVVQATGSNLNAVISGSLTSAGTVSQATASSLNCTAVVAGATLQAGATTDITSAALGAGTVNSNQVSTGSLQASSFAIYVTAVSGTPTYDIDVQETMDGTSYYTIYSFERITATGQYYSPVIKHSGSGLRYVRTVGGTTPSVTSSVVRVSRQGQAETMRRFINRTIVPNTLNSNTGSFFCDGVEDFNLIVRCTAQTTAATIALEFSHDNTNWFTSTASVTTAVGIVQAKIINEQWKFVRATVTAAGTGITLGEVTIGGHSA